MTSPSFDPCKQWLGIDAVDLGDPRRVLGVPPDVVDAQAIIRAATIKLSLLQSVAPGPFAMAHAALVRRVTEARDTLLAEAAAAAPPRFSMPPPPPSMVMPAAPAVPPMPHVPAPQFPSAPVPLPPPVPQAATEPTISFTTRAVPNYRPQSAAGPLMLVAVAALSAVAGVMAYQALQPRPKPAPEPPRVVAATDPRGQNDDGAKRVIKRIDDPRRPLEEDRGVSTSPPPKYQEQEHARRRVEMKQPGDAEPAAPSEKPMVAARREPEPEENEAEPEKPVTDEPEGAKPEVEPVVGDEPTPPPSDDPPPADATVQPLLKEAFAAIQKQEYDGAKLALAAARKAASTATVKDRITSFEELNDCAEKFFAYRDKALAAVRPGIEYDIPTATTTRQIAVIELNDEEFVFKEAGSTKRIPRDKIPAAVLTHIVREWFDDRPENHLFLGAYFATRPEPDLAKAGEEWATAQAGGAEASGLLRLLDDPILEAAAE